MSPSSATPLPESALDAVFAGAAGSGSAGLASLLHAAAINTDAIAHLISTMRIYSQVGERRATSAGFTSAGYKDVDTDAEHDPARANTHSKAALHRVADAGKDKSALHDKASQKTYSSVQSGLLLLAKEMNLSHQDLREAQQDDPEHNNQVGVGTLERIVHMISADASNLNTVMAATENASTMGAEVKKVWGAWFTCQPEIDRALTCYRANGGAQQLSTAGIDQNVKAMIDKLGAKPEDLAQDRVAIALLRFA